MIKIIVQQIIFDKYNYKYFYFKYIFILNKNI